MELEMGKGGFGAVVRVCGVAMHGVECGGYLTFWPEGWWGGCGVRGGRVSEGDCNVSKRRT